MSFHFSRQSKSCVCMFVVRNSLTTNCWSAAENGESSNEAGIWSQIFTNQGDHIVFDLCQNLGPNPHLWWGKNYFSLNLKKPVIFVSLNGNVTYWDGANSKLGGGEWLVTTCIDIVRTLLPCYKVRIVWFLITFEKYDQEISSPMK